MYHNSAPYAGRSRGRLHADFLLDRKERSIRQGRANASDPETARAIEHALLRRRPGPATRAGPMQSASITDR